MKTDPPTRRRRGIVPIVIGVTGHRDLGDLDAVGKLKARVAEFFRNAERRNPNSPLVLLSALAPGADCLAARVALDRGHRLIPVLPTPAAEYSDIKRLDYEKHFPFSVAEFDALLAHKHTEKQPIVMPETGRADDQDLRGLMAGAFVVRNCQELIAIWNPNERAPDDSRFQRGMGGTAQNVRFQRTGRFAPEIESSLRSVPAPYWTRSSALDELETGLVYHINPAGSHEADDYLGPGGRVEREKRDHVRRFHDSYKNIDGLNREVARTLSSRALRERSSKTLESAKYLLPFREAINLPRSLRRLRKNYSQVDTLAVLFRDRTRRTLIGMFALVFVAVIGFAAYAHLVEYPYYHWPLAAYIALLVVADVLYLGANWRRYQDKHQDYRALAEGLRVEFYWRLAGVESSVPDHYLRKQKSELDWIREAVRTCGLAVRPAPGDNTRLTLNHWIDEQHDYFKAASARDYARLLRLKETGSGVLAVSIGLAVSEMLCPEPLPLPLVAVGLAVVAAGIAHFGFKVKEIVDEARKEEEEHDQEVTRRKLKPRELARRGWLLLPYAMGLGVGWYQLRSGQVATRADRFALLPAVVTLTIAFLHFGVGELSRRLKLFRLEIAIKTVKNYFYGINLGLLVMVLLLKTPRLLPHSLSVYLKEGHHEVEGNATQCFEHDWVIVAMGLTALLAALLHSYAEKSALAAHHKQYRRMLKVFARARDRLRELLETGDQELAAGELVEARKLISELGNEALAEHADWVMLHRERPMELPKAEI